MAQKAKFNAREAASKIDLDELMQAVRTSMFGTEYVSYCLGCGAQHFSGYEPDTRGGECESCGESKVYGAEEVLLMVAP
jgi:hypothetical protein